MPVRFTAGGRTYQGAAATYGSFFTPLGLFVAAYILIGVFFNTVPPHLPTVAFSLTALHSWIQYVISVFLWPLSLWHPTFSVSQWPAGSTH